MKTDELRSEATSATDGDTKNKQRISFGKNVKFVASCKHCEQLRYFCHVITHNCIEKETITLMPVLQLR